ncbi:MAG: TerB family tellurite resistance protein [Gammaproteobacteria bacterium]|nr:TerB family tellurite resistance protein [Gammaproteobacteria bacterium]
MAIEIPMFKSIKSYFEEKLSVSKLSDDQDITLISSTELASAALLVEVMNSDHELDERESQEFIKVLQSSLKIPEEDLQELVRLAESQAEQATSLYEFTRLINDEYDYNQKLDLIHNMWRIAFSDEKLDKYEDHLIRKVSELIYVTHSDFIKTKLQARDT